MGFFSPPPVLSLPGVKPRTQTAAVLPWESLAPPAERGGGQLPTLATPTS